MLTTIYLYIQLNIKRNSYIELKLNISFMLKVKITFKILPNIFKILQVNEILIINEILLKY